MNKLQRVLLLVVLTAVFGYKAYPSNAEKNAGPLRLSRPVETPDGVQFSWTAGAEGTTYSIYRRLKGDAWWERIAMNLTGVSGSTFVSGFTLDKTFEYKIQADEP